MTGQKLVFAWGLTVNIDALCVSSRKKEHNHMERMRKMKKQLARGHEEGHGERLWGWKAGLAGESVV